MDKFNARNAALLYLTGRLDTDITLCIDQVVCPILLTTLFLILLRSVGVIPRILVPRRSTFGPSRPLVELVQDLGRDAVEKFLGVDAQQAPGEVDGFVDGPGLVGGLRDEGAFELVEKFERELVFGGQGFLTYDGLHGGWMVSAPGEGPQRGGKPTCISPDGVFCVELIRDVAVVFACVALSDRRFHETGQRW